MYDLTGNLVPKEWVVCDGLVVIGVVGTHGFTVEMTHETEIERLGARFAVEALA